MSIQLCQFLFLISLNNNFGYNIVEIKNMKRKETKIHDYSVFVKQFKFACNGSKIITLHNTFIYLFYSFKNNVHMN